MTLSQGARLGPYEIAALIGAGGMGEVYRAKDTRLGRDVAVKVLPKIYSSDPERLRRFEQEARTVALLNHPNILALYDVGTHEGAPYVVSELLEGDTFRDRLAGGALSERRAIEYATAIAQGLAAAHEKGVVHRDLKPENLFLTKDGRVKILDFGLAKLMGPEESDAAASSAPTTPAATQPGVVLGTMGYMSPEQVRGQKADHRADLFTFGAILFEMVTGKRAFQGQSTVETLNAILKEDPPDWDASANVSPAVGRIITHCLEKNPEGRFQSARDLAFALESSSGPRAAAAPAPAMKRRWRVLPAVAAAMAVVAAVAAGFFAGRRGGGTQPAAFQRLTFRRGTVLAARFAPEGKTIVYSAAWDGKPPELFSVSPGSPESRTLGITGAKLLSVSPSGEMALLLMKGPGLPDWQRSPGTLARAPLSGGAPREVLEDVRLADWAPDGTSLAIVRSVAERDRLEFPVGKVLYETAGHIKALRISPRGDLFAFAEASSIYGMDGSIAVADLNGKKRTLAGGLVSDFVEMAWSGPDEIWFGTRSGGDDTLYAVDLSGRKRLLARPPDPLQMFDLASDGRALIGRSTHRAAITGLAPGETRERDFSWLELSEVDDVTPDGKTLLITEYGKGGGAGRWSVYLRKTDGSPAVRLGEGQAFRFSPDGKLALSMTVSPPQLVLLPVGPGEPVRIRNESIRAYMYARWLPDGKRILFTGDQPGQGVRCYLQEIPGGRPKAITPLISPDEFALSPDGKWVVVNGLDGKPAMYPVEAGSPRPIAQAEKGWQPFEFSPDGQFLYLYQAQPAAVRVERLHLASGRREQWKEIALADPTGFLTLWNLRLAAGGKSYFYTYGRDLSDLYLVEGMR